MPATGHARISRGPLRTRGFNAMKKIVVNVGITETRVALLDKEVLTDLAIERTRTRSIVGNVYKGVVMNVLPGMQAAFVDIGLPKDAFLYVGDFLSHMGAYEQMMLDEDGGVELDEGDREGEPERKRDLPSPPIEDVLKKGQEILVQVAKESLGTKGARITSFVSLPGRYLVYMPQVAHVGVSRRIKDERERDRLRKLIKKVRPQGNGGFIIRTVAEGLGEGDFAQDMDFLRRLWGAIQARHEQGKAPAVLHEEMDLTFRVVRDLFSADVEEFVVDSKEVYNRTCEFVASLVPALVDRVKLYEGRTPIFEQYGIEKEIERALRRKVWLKSGGYIVIDQTEALVAIDVNTGKYVGKRDLEQTILKINLEAVDEIVRQIRLRDLGGIIILDFIDMESEEHRNKVYKALRKALAEDKARTNVLQISELGLVEMTRKRVRQDLRSLLTEDCPTCGGTGDVRSSATIVAEILRKVQAAAEAGGREIILRVHPEVAKHLQDHVREEFEAFQTKVQRPLTLQPLDGFHKEEYEIISR